MQSLLNLIKSLNFDEDEKSFKLLLKSFYSRQKHIEKQRKRKRKHIQKN